MAINHRQCLHLPVPESSPYNFGSWMQPICKDTDAWNSRSCKRQRCKDTDAYNLRSCKRRRCKDTIDACHDFRSCKRQRCKDAYEKCKDDTSSIVAGEHGFGSSYSDDVMQLIFIRLSDSVTRLRFSAVCRQWRQVAQCCCHLIPPQFPWFKLFGLHHTSYRLFFSLSDGITHKMHSPEFKEMLFCGNFEGWFVMKTQSDAKKRKIFLIDPLSKAKIHLPIKSIDYPDNSKIVTNMPQRFRIYLSSAPISDDGVNDINDKCLAVAVTDENEFYLCRLGGRSWIRQHFIESYQSMRFECILFHNGSFIAVDYEPSPSHVKILEMVVESEHPLKLKAEMHSLPLPHFGDQNYGDLDLDHYDADQDDKEKLKSLIEWRGELYLLLYHQEYVSDAVAKTSKAFYLYKFDHKWDLVKVDNLGDGVIFFSRSDLCKCFSVNDFPSLNLKGNCVYCTEADWSDNPVAWYNTRVFRLADGKWDTDLYQRLSYEYSTYQEVRFPVLWYTPRISY